MLRRPGALGKAWGFSLPALYRRAARLRDYGSGATPDRTHDSADVSQRACTLRDVSHTLNMAAADGSERSIPGANESLWPAPVGAAVRIMDAHSLERLDFQRIRDVVASYALTGLGRALAQTIRPIARAALVQRWLQQVRELQRLIEQRGMPPFGGVTDVREILLRCGPPLRITVDETAQIGATLEGTHALAEYLRDLPPDCPELTHLAGRVGDFQTIAQRIRTVIDERGHVRDDASPKLAGLRREVEDATRQIQQTIEHQLRDADVRRLLQYPNHTFHGDRLVLPVRAEYRGRLAGIVHRVSDSGATLYVEPAAIVELNNLISNLRSAEQEEIGRLLWDLSQEIHLNGREIHRTLDTLAVLDLIAAKVRLARDFELHCPELAADGTLNVRGARHPLLLELARRKQAAGEPPLEVVPIDYRVGQDFNLLIVTGPNTGGKTVTLKTIGLLCLMLQAGVPVPVAPGSQFGLFSNVLIDVGDEQNIQQSLSTFSAHLTRIIDMLRHAGPRTLLLMDELGAGTDPDEGAALGRAILEELLRLQCRGVVTTHLGALKAFALMHQGAENACVEFDTETLRPTFHLAIGEPGQSNAIEVAQRLGMSKRMIGAARRSLSRKARTLQVALEGTRRVKRQAEEARRQAEEAHVEATKTQSEAQEARVRLERQQADFQRWVQRVVHLRPGDAVRVRDFDRDGKIVRLRLDQQRAEVDVGAFWVEVPLGDVLPPETPVPPPRPPRPAVVAGTERPRPARRRDGRPESGRRAAPTSPPAGPAHEPRRETPPPEPVVPPLTEAQLAALQPEDAIYVRRFHREGRLVRLKPAKQIAIVNVGLLEVEVPYSGLGLLSVPERPPARSPVPSPSANLPPKAADAPVEPGAEPTPIQPPPPLSAAEPRP
jgi:DNA mismatch repair protein MutS2